MLHNKIVLDIVYCDYKQDINRSVNFSSNKLAN